MANLSSANGICEITAPKKEMKNLLLFFKNIQEKFYYNLGLYELETDDLRNSIEIRSFSDTHDRASLIINGFGRWTYENNIDLKNFIQSVNEDPILAKQWADLQQSDLPIQIEFDYVDYEPGCEVFYEARQTWSFEPETNKWFSDIIYSENIDITAYNLIKYDITDVAIDKTNVFEVITSWIPVDYPELGALLNGLTKDQQKELAQDLASKTDGIYLSVEEWLDNNPLVDEHRTIEEYFIENAAALRNRN